ncbi:MAG TPA: hypothetical protein VII40_19350 [Xanthobacteraceae bacterium]
MKALVLESTSPFQRLPELVAYDEGLFGREGIRIEWADRDERRRQGGREPRCERQGRRSVRQPHCGPAARF